MSTVAKEIKAAKEPKQSIWKGVKRVRISDFVIAFVILILSLTCILPFLHVAAKSVSSNNAVLSKSVYLWPKEFSLDAYTAIFKDGQLTHSMWYTILVTVLFTFIGMFVTTLAAYPLSVRSLKGRSFFAFIIMFTMYFSAGLIPEYLLYQSLGLRNTMWVLVLPLCFAPYNMLIMRSFLASTIPESLYEAAFLDGASHFQILGRIVLPLSKPIIATLLLFYSVGRWNAYGDNMYYIKLNEKLKMIQYLLYQMVTTANEAQTIAFAEGSAQQTNPEVVQSAAIMVTTLPILVIYPFVQKHFVKGAMIGSVKG